MPFSSVFHVFDGARPHVFCELSRRGNLPGQRMALLVQRSDCDMRSCVANDVTSCVLQVVEEAPAVLDASKLEKSVCFSVSQRQKLQQNAANMNEQRHWIHCSV